MTTLQLEFSSDKRLELFRLSVRLPLATEELTAVRGKTGGAFAKARTFQWTTAVKALCVLILRNAATHRLGQEPFVLEGSNGTLASSLDYAIGKETAWLDDCFGRDSSGKFFAKRIFLRSNPEQKRAGPASISLNYSFLEPIEIEIIVDGKDVSLPAEFQLLADSIEQDYFATRTYVISESKTKTSNKIESIITPQILRTKLRPVILQETREMLLHTDIFSKAGLQKTVSGITSSQSFSNVAGKNVNLLSDVDKQLYPTQRLGIAENETHLKKLLNPDDAISVALAAPGAASTALFFYLKYVKNYNLELNFRHVHAVEIARRLVEGDFQTPPDLCALGVAPAASLLARGKHTGYEAVMILPKVGQKIVAPLSSDRRSKELNFGQYLFITDDPSVPSFMFDELIRDGYIQQSKISTKHMEPDETLTELQSGDPDNRAILFFPHYHFNEWFNSCQIISDPRTEQTNQEFVLFAHESFRANSERLQAIDIAIRDAWLELKMNPTSLEGTVDLMVNNVDYINFLGRCGGLHNLA